VGLYAHLESFALDAVWLVHEYIRATTNCNLAGRLVKCYGLKGICIVDVNRLEERLRTAEDNQRVAGMYAYWGTRGGKGQQQGALNEPQSWIINPATFESTYNNTKTIPQRRAERLELRWGSPRQYRSHRGGWFWSRTLVALENTLQHCQIKY
jgi:hypothetical protein